MRTRLSFNLPTRFATALRGLVAPWPQASCSRCLKRNIQELAGRFLMFQPLSQHSQCEGLYFGHGFSVVGAVAEHAREIRNFGYPSTVLFTFELDLEDHKGTLTSSAVPNNRGQELVFAKRLLIS